MSEKEENIGDIAKKLSDRHPQVLALALKTAQERVAEDPSAANISAMAAAKRAMDEAMASAQAPVAEVLPNTQEVVRYLQRRGYQVKKSKVYADARAGKLPRGSCSVDDAYRYATREDLPRLAEVANGELDRKALEKIDLENQHSRLKIQRLEIEIAEKSGDLIPAIERDQHIAGTIAVIKHKLLHMAQSRSAEMLEVGVKNGQQAHADLLIDFILGEFDDIGRQEALEVVSIAASA